MHVFVQAASWIGGCLSLCFGSNLKHSTELQLSDLFSFDTQLIFGFAAYEDGRSSSSRLSLWEMRMLRLCSAWWEGVPRLGHQLLQVSEDDKRVRDGYVMNIHSLTAVTGTTVHFLIRAIIMNKM